jgi:hypothetical protein
MTKHYLKGQSGHHYCIQCLSNHQEQGGGRSQGESASTFAAVQSASEPDFRHSVCWNGALYVHCRVTTYSLNSFFRFSLATKIYMFFSYFAELTCQIINTESLNYHQESTQTGIIILFWENQRKGSVLHFFTAVDSEFFSSTNLGMKLSGS